MLFKRPIKWKLVGMILWVLLSISIHQHGMVTCLDSSYLCASLNNEMAPSMLLMSFPAGILGFLFVLPFLEGGSLTAYSVLWLSMFVAGFVQWFVVVPNMFGPRIISLGLSTRSELSQTDSSVIEPVSTRRTKSRPRRRRPIPAYDRHGLTPLERAIRTRSPDR